MNENNPIFLYVNATLKKYILAIHSEIDTLYYSLPPDVDDSQIKDFCNSVITIIDYYIKPISCAAKKTITKEKEDPEKVQEFIEKYKMEDLSQFEDFLIQYISDEKDNLSQREVYVNILENILYEMIFLFHRTQLLMCSEKNIFEVNIISNNNSCPSCQTLSRFSWDVEYLLKNINLLHNECFLNIEPIIKSDILVDFSIKDFSTKFINVPKNHQDKVQSFVNLLYIKIPSLITDKTFIFVDDIYSTEHFNNSIIKSKINDNLLSVSNIKNDIVLINSDNEYKQLLIIKELIQERILDFDISWWYDNFYKIQSSKQIVDNIYSFENGGFINIISEQSPENYFIESAVYYIYDPEYLFNIDPENYNELKRLVFRDVEFTKKVVAI